MKRSEMVKQMKWWIDDQLYNKDIELADGSFVQTDETDEESVSDMLEFMEKEGMSPPDHGEEIWDGYTTFRLRTWEPEDET